jgi:two-component system, cell cycle response regulator
MTNSSKQPTPERFSELQLDEKWLSALASRNTDHFGVGEELRLATSGVRSRKSRHYDPSDLERQWHVLVVDDDSIQRTIIARLLMRAGFSVDTAHNGREALERINSKPYQILITDWDMPEMSGPDLCREVHALEVPHYIYKSLLTERDAIEHLVAGLKAGADDYLTKPVLEPEFLARLNQGKRILSMESALRTSAEKFRNLSTTDSLTGAYNRGHLNSQLPLELQGCANAGLPLSLIMCDVDHFKRVNDTWGHRAGDLVIQQVVQQIRENIRTIDWVARYGGEEFMIVLPQTPFSSAVMIAETLRMSLKAKPIHSGSNTISITASFGVIGWEDRVPIVEDYGQLFDQLAISVDKALYTSKSEGRDRVTIGINQWHAH